MLLILIVVINTFLKTMVYATNTNVAVSFFGIPKGDFKVIIDYSN